MQPGFDLFAAVFAANALLGAGVVLAQDGTDAAPGPTAESINSASLESLSPEGGGEAGSESSLPDPAITRLQVLLDRAGSSPGAIDGFFGENVQKAVVAYEKMQGLEADGLLDSELLSSLEGFEPVVEEYSISEEDAADIVAAVPADYAEMAEMEFIGFTSIEEKLAERFHMDIDLLRSLNPGSAFEPGDVILVTDAGENRGGEVARIQADKALRQVRAYDATGTLLAAYPATIGSESTPSPSGTHEVVGVAAMPEYTYNPEVNFQQGDNTEILTIPPGPNGPVGSMWIDLSEPTYGIHGTPEPSLIDKVASHGCIRLTNWDAEELAAMVAPGVTVEFLGG